MDALRSALPAQAPFSDASGDGRDPSEAVARISIATRTGASCRVLNVGCGTGTPALDLAGDVGCDVVGVDLLLPVLSMARRQRAIPQTGGRVRLVAARPTALPFGAARFDRVWCLGVAGQVEDLVAFGQEVSRVLVPGGMVAMTEAFWDGMRPPRFARAAPPGWQALTADTLLGLLARAGLVDVQVTPWPAGAVPDASRLHDQLLRDDLADRRLAPHLVVARKP